MLNKLPSKHKLPHGFTLIELVIVIAILGILAGIAIPRFLDANASAKGAKIVADLRTIDSAATIFNAQNGQYPTAINSADPATEDGFIGKYLAAWPVPDPGTFIVTQFNGTPKTYKDITAAYYTLNTEGRALYDGHPVEWYLNGGNTNFTDTNLIKAISTISTYLSQSGLSWNDKCGTTLNSKITDMTVDESILAAAGYTGTMYWHTNTGTPYYFANYNYGTSGNQWTANIIEVNGTVYALKKNTNNGSISDSAPGTTDAERMQAGLEAMVVAGTATRLGTIATK